MSIEETLSTIVREVSQINAKLDRLESPRVARADDLIAYEEAAAIADVKPATIGAWTRRGHLKRYGTLKKPLVKESELRAYRSQLNRKPEASSPEETALFMLRKGRAR